MVEQGFGVKGLRVGGKGFAVVSGGGRQLGPMSNQLIECRWWGGAVMVGLMMGCKQYLVCWEAVGMVILY